MAKDFVRVVWSKQAEHDIDSIYLHYLTHSPETALKRILEIIQATDQLIFANQWKIDEFDPSCRRIIVKKNYRILYKKIQNDILITRIYPNKTNIADNYS
jgi:plasmid stabilization system protein ParE